jgi:hypothetical protein
MGLAKVVEVQYDRANDEPLNSCGIGIIVWRCSETDAAPPLLAIEVN